MMDNPQEVRYTTSNGHLVVLDAPEKLVIEQGFACIYGGLIKVNGKQVRLLVRYDDKPELAAKVAEWQAAQKKYEAEKAAEFARNVPGLKELEVAQDAAGNEEERYEYEFNRMMDSEGGLSPKPIDTTLRAKANELAQQYPRAAMYLWAKRYTYSRNHHKYGAGKDAMELIASGGSLDDARQVLVNWTPEESIWN